MGKFCIDRCSSDPLPYDAFYRHPKSADVFMGRCKTCHKRAVNERRDLKREYIRNYKAEFAKRPEQKEKRKNALRRHRIKHPDRSVARNAVSNAIRDGRLKKEPCVYCGEPNSQAHHHDYSKPLDVVWACFRCHREREHGQIVI